MLPEAKAENVVNAHPESWLNRIKNFSTQLYFLPPSKEKKNENLTERYEGRKEFKLENLLYMKNKAWLWDHLPHWKLEGR
jgi:hypothetical protein